MTLYRFVTTHEAASSPIRALNCEGQRAVLGEERKHVQEQPRWGLYPTGTASVDIAIFCLALMGTDYPSFLQEAARVLKPQGTIWIAEVGLDTELLACRIVASP
jgi:hypothetical protein